MKLYVNGIEIKFILLEWSGSKYNAARRVDFSVASNLPYKFSMGNPVRLVENGKTIFSGILFRREKSSKTNEIPLTAFEPMVYLLKSEGSYNFKESTLGNVVRKVASDLGLSVGSVVDSNTKIKLEPQIGVECYRVLLSACKEAKKKTKSIYLPIIKNNKLYIEKAGEVVREFELSNKVNILDSTYTESIENVINKVIIVDDKGKKIGQVTGEGIKTWGTFQSVYQKEEKKNANSEAKKLLNGLEREATVDGIGDVKCISGKAVYIKDSITGLKGKFYIDEDSHSWKNGYHTMTLVLNYRNEMEGE